ncbi:UNVERIFIED_CONTAM: flagellar hook-associated family protein [Methylobacteriaceae bacterium AG10]|nr:flagellar hook-associated family protein [Methylobacteriaceae bacterium AG10]
MMTTGFISSLNLWNAPRTGVGRLQADLATATKEISTGRFADVGATLGGGVAGAFGLRGQSAVLAALTQSNTAASLRLNATQTALQEIQSAAEATLNELTALPADQRAAMAAESTRGRLAALAGTLNTSAGGQFVFGGTNSATAPLTPYEGIPASPAKTAVDGAFVSFFGFAPGDPAASGITPAEIKGFIDGMLTGQFTEVNWSGTWSEASSRTIDSRISLTETVTTSVSANAEPFRKLGMAYVIASALGLAGLSQDAQAVAMGKVTDLLGEASRSLTTMRADLGRAQSQITEANARMAKQTALLTGQIRDLESVDPAEAKSRVDAITTQMQMSYGLTAQLRSLSLINFIS